MKSFPKILTIFFLTIFILQLICLIFLLMAPTASQAKETPISFTPQVEMPGYEFNSADKSTKNIANYIRAIYKYAIGIVGILAAVILMVGGIIWLTAGGNASMITEAKAWITASLTGLILALCSYFILATVNPNLVNFKLTEIKTIEELKNPIELREGDLCIESTPPFCISGLTCKNGKCEKDIDAIGQDHLSSEYKWIDTPDCSKNNKINFGDTFCSNSKKPSLTHRCCGYFLKNEPTKIIPSTKPRGYCLTKESPGVFWCDNYMYERDCGSSLTEKLVKGTFSANKKCDVIKKIDGKTCVTTAVGKAFKITCK